MESAGGTPPRHMSLIRHPVESSEVILQRGKAVVLYDARSHQLTVREDGEPTDCPWCGRPLHDEYAADPSEGEDEPATPSAARPFDRGETLMNPDYFRLLAASRNHSPTSSAGPSTPNRYVSQPALTSARSTVSESKPDLPSGAEFVGSEPRTTSGQGISSSSFSPGYFRRFFREIRELGRGGNGVVLLVEHVLDDISLGLFACKRIPVGNDHSWLQKVIVEVTLLRDISHSNLISYRFVWLEDYQPSKFGPPVPCLWILQAYCNGGDLHKYVLGPQQDRAEQKDRLKDRLRRKSRDKAEPPEELRGPSRLTFEEIFSFFQDITAGLHHLHTHGYIHRDLKPSNCLIHSDGSGRKILISDFGEVQAAGAIRNSTGATGTISYCAPEVLRQDETDGTFGEFTTKSDIFSLGMIVYFMCFGRLPYNSVDDLDEEEEDLDELRAEIMHWQGFDDATRARPDLPERLYRFLKRLLSVDPGERPSTGEILASIKGGVEPGEGGLVDDINAARVSSLGSSRPHPSAPSRRPPVTLSRPGLSTIGRRSSSEASHHASPTRAPQASRDRHGLETHSSPASPVDQSLIMRRRKVDPSSLPANDPHPPQTPRLMLPPPERRSPVRQIVHLASHSGATAALRATLFGVKVLSLTRPCAPYAPTAWLLYLLLGLAALDLGLLAFDSRRSLLLLGLHATAVVLAQQQGRLCEGHVLLWPEEP